MPYNANKNEQEILKYWDENKTFEQSVESRPTDKPYVFYDGPPFATGLPHYGHIVASLMKDVVPRYWTMHGNRVERVWGWDCHGLPIENIVEKELNLKTKQDIEDFGIDKFNQACESKVLTYAEEWKKTVRRMGRWVDMENAYKTMDLGYMESIWWVFKELWNKNLIYEGYKAMHICPRCVTPLSNFEVTQGYKDVKDISVVVKFGVRSSEFKEKLDLEGDLYILAWTTTPWTLPGNVLLAVGEDIDYLLVKRFTGKWMESGEAIFDEVIIAEDIFERYKKDPESIVAEPFHFSFVAIPEGNVYEQDYNPVILKKIKGRDLVGLEYEPLFPYFAETENGFRVVAADFVDTEEGTGVVHIAPAFGQDDYEIGQREKTGWVQHVTMEGKFTDEVKDFVGMEVKPKEDPTKTDVEILKWLANNGKLFSKAKYEHSYPHCWRCDTPLLNYSTSSWFVRVAELKDDLLKNNKDINWVPEHIKEGRFGKWLEGAKDWAISRNRYWGSPLPIWKSEAGDIICVGSVKELEELSGQKVDNLHKHKVDEIVIKKDGKEYKRIPEVLDCWFESGSMPYAQMHYPFENEKKFEDGFPAQFIAEGQDQTRGWFYTLHVLATALTTGKSPSIPVKKTTSSFQNVIVNGIVLAEDGKKMSKRLNNYPDPMEVLEKYGADAMRYYLVSSPVMHAESLNFSEEGVREVYNKVCNTLWNVFTFYQMFASSRKSEVVSHKSENVLDKWILAKLNILLRDVTENMNEYKLAEASRPILEFITDLSQWYVRRSRDRFKGNDEEDKQNALATLREVLLTLSKIMAPFTPFIAEKIYREVGGESESVHLESWPEYNKKLIDQDILTAMQFVRSFATMAHMQRKEKGKNVRQPLLKLSIKHNAKPWPYWDETKNILADEINVKEVVLDPLMTQDGPPIRLDINITPELKKEGLAREIIRAINQIRKEQKLTIEDTVVVEYSTDDELLNSVFSELADEIKAGVLASELKPGGKTEVEIDGRKISLSVEK